MENPKDKKPTTSNKFPQTKKLDTSSKIVSKTSRIIKVTQPTAEEQEKIEKQKKFFFKLKYFMFVSIPFLLFILIILVIFKPFKSKASLSSNSEIAIITELDEIKNFTYEQKKSTIKNWDYKYYSRMISKLDKARDIDPNAYKDVYKIIVEFKEISDSDYNDIEKIRSYVEQAEKIYDNCAGVRLPQEYYDLLIKAKNLCETIFNKYPKEWGPTEVQTLKKFKHSEIDPRLEGYGN